MKYRVTETRPNPARAGAPVSVDENGNPDTELPGNETTMRLSPAEIDGAARKALSIVRGEEQARTMQAEVLKPIKNFLNKHGNSLAAFVGTDTINNLAKLASGDSAADEAIEESVRIRRKFGFSTPPISRPLTQSNLAKFAEQFRL